MKRIYVITVAFLASWSVCTANDDQQFVQKTKPYNKCPDQDVYPSIYIPHESDCTKFYKCFMGKKVEQSCPLMSIGSKRLHYNRNLQVCDWPWKAGCESCPGKDEDSYPQESLIADPESTNCNQYIICRENGQQDPGICPQGLCFSRTCQKCVTDLKSDCEDINIPIPDFPTATIKRTMTAFITCTTGDRKSHECDCAKFYQCYSNQDWIRQQCDGGLHFSPTKSKCLPPDEANCLSVGNLSN